MKLHADGCCKVGNPAVNVKVYGLDCTTQDVIKKFGCSEEQAERALQFAFEQACQAFWEYWQDETGEFENGIYGSPEYAYFPNEKVTISSEGRMGGWLVVYGLPPVDKWDNDMQTAWDKFEQAVMESVRGAIASDVLLDAIEANQWYKAHSEQYNMITTSKGDVCIADAKAGVADYAINKFGFIPNLP